MSHEVSSDGCSRTLRRWCADESGAVDALSYVLMASIVAIGMIAGLTTFRNDMAQAFGDISDALQSISQTYTVSMTFAQIGGGTTVQSYGYNDSTSPPAQVAGTPPACMDLLGPATPE